MKFQCVDECAQCCIEREYFPSERFGKVGVLLLPEERDGIARLAEKLGVRARVLPRVGVSREGASGPEQILGYQLMGVDGDGNTCPFLDTSGKGLSPHGGFACRIYHDRPLACRAYPLVGTDPITLDQKCRFCQECATPDGNLESEREALIRIKGAVSSERATVWRYATDVGDSGDQLAEGWVEDP